MDNLLFIIAGILGLLLFLHYAKQLSHIVPGSQQETLLSMR